MSKFEQLHPDILNHLGSCRSYKQLSTTGNVLEAWEKRDDGKWYDVTLREQEKQRLEREIKQAQRELAEE